MEGNLRENYFRQWVVSWFTKLLYKVMNSHSTLQGVHMEWTHWLLLFPSSSSKSNAIPARCAMLKFMMHFKKKRGHYWDFRTAITVINWTLNICLEHIEYSSETAKCHLAQRVLNVGEWVFIHSLFIILFWRASWLSITVNLKFLILFLSFCIPKPSILIFCTIETNAASSCLCIMVSKVPQT